MLKKIIIDKANRTYQFPPDLFSFISDNDKPSLIKKTELIDLGKFNWNVPYDKDFCLTPPELETASASKSQELKESIADWFYEQHKVKLNPKREIFIGGSISQILFATALAYIETGDLVFVPELGLPVYRKVTTAAGGETVSYDISSKSNWKPHFKKLTTRVGHVSRLLFLNSPHNPTGSTLNQSELEQLVLTASKENIAIINDAGYQSVVGEQSSSLIGTKNGKRIGIEIYSFSYQFGLPQLPFGFAIGSKEMIEGLSQTSSFYNSQVPNYYVDMALEGLRKFPSDNISQLQKQILKSKTEAEKLFELLNIESFGANIFPFIWGKLPKRKPSNKFSTQLFRKFRILTVPGIAFGNNAEGYIRLSLTASQADYQDAYSRVKDKLSLLKNYSDSDE